MPGDLRASRSTPPVDVGGSGSASGLCEVRLYGVSDALTLIRRKMQTRFCSPPQDIIRRLRPLLGFEIVDLAGAETRPEIFGQIPF